MKEVILAKSQGFCYGVRRAIEIAGREKGSGIIYGELVHNPVVTKQMADEGKRSVRNLDATTGATTFITAHGVSDSVKAELAARASKLIDATCPLVTKVHDAARKFEAQGYQVVLVGEHGHPESNGTIGNLRHGILVETLEEAHALQVFPKLAIIAQTTIDVNHFHRMSEILAEKGDDYLIENTICVPTRDRQAAAHQLAPTVDAMVVVGGKNSSNTVRLRELSEAYCPTVHVTTAEELDPVWFRNFNRIGVTAGASTPDGTIQDVISRIKTF